MNLIRAAFGTGPKGRKGQAKARKVYETPTYRLVRGRGEDAYHKELRHDNIRTLNEKAKDVYFVRGAETGLIKIGASWDPENRVNQLENSCYHTEPLELIGILPKAGFSKETELHHQFEDSCVYGEWFKPTKELETFIEENATLDVKG